MSTPKSDFRIAILPGDGVGEEVVAASLKVLDVLEAKSDFRFNRTMIPGGGAYYEKHGKEWPDGSLEKVKDADAVILGAVGHDGPDGEAVRREDGELAGYELVVGLRQKLDLYANYRPVRLFNGVPHKIHGELKPVWHADKVNMVIIRENTEDAYVSGASRIERAGITELVVSPIIITRKGAERVIRKAFETAMTRDGAPNDGKKRVTCVDKSNIIQAHRLFRSIFKEIATEYPEIETDFAYVDAFCQWLIRNPEFYDVVVAPNFAGDIVTDLAAVLQGGLGIAAGGNIGDHHAMFEPIHGSAPKHAGLDKVNPIATVLSIKMMLDWLGEQHNVPALNKAAALLEDAVEEVVRNQEGRTYDLGGSAKCSEVGAMVAEVFEQKLS
jgi:isocitrate/isopropylmalate dehydrogenase